MLLLKALGDLTVVSASMWFHNFLGGWVKKTAGRRWWPS